MERGLWKTVSRQMVRQWTGRTSDKRYIAWEGMFARIPPPL
jgi:hypothetical protein